MISRRRFLENACAAAAAFGLPARVWGAADALGKPDLVIGLLSDIHIQMPPTVARPEALKLFRHALEYFRDRHVDGVLVSGDLANAGLETELKAVADALARRGQSLSVHVCPSNDARPVLQKAIDEAYDLGVRCVLLKGDYEGRACE